MVAFADIFTRTPATKRVSLKTRKGFVLVSGYKCYNAGLELVIISMRSPVTTLLWSVTFAVWLSDLVKGETERFFREDD
ncbi:MAG: hypothetical protein ACI9OU_001686 [Candidatus Promineifilaceae bacterium]|jgi:hypothetical protein